MTIQHTHAPRVPDNASEQTLGADYDGDTLRGGRTSARTATHVDTTPPDSLSLARPKLPQQQLLAPREWLEARTVAVAQVAAQMVRRPHRALEPPNS